MSTFGRLLRSDHAGETWTEAIRTLHASTIAALAMHGGTLYAAQGSPLERRRNGGRTWQPLERRGHVCCGRVSALATDPANPDIVFAGNGFGLFRSADGGATWQRRGGPGGQLGAIAAAPFDSRIVFARSRPTGAASTPERSATASFRAASASAARARERSLDVVDAVPTASVLEETA